MGADVRRGRGGAPDRSGRGGPPELRSRRPRGRAPRPSHRRDPDPPDRHRSVGGSALGAWAANGSAVAAARAEGSAMSSHADALLAFEGPRAANGAPDGIPADPRRAITAG